MIVALVFAIITTLAAFVAYRFGVYLGRDIEYVHRSEPLLRALKLIADATVSPDPQHRASYQTIHTIAEKNFRVYHPHFLEEPRAPV